MVNKVTQSVDADLKAYGLIKTDYDDLRSQISGKGNQADIDSLTASMADNAKKLDALQVPITKFGADPSLVDNISAIQQTINYVDSLGGGTVLIPNGTFYVKPIHGTSNNILLKNNIRIKGVSRNTSIIKIHSTTGDWGELFSYPTPASVMYNIAFEDLTFDCNINNVVTTTTFWDKHRMWINGGYTYNYLIRNVHFICNGVWSMHGNVMNSRFINNEVEYNTTGVPAIWWDVSAVWWGGKNNDISNNVVWTSGNCGFVPETGIEFQGHNFHVHDNKVLGYANGILPTPYTDTTSGVITLDVGGRGIKVYNNTIEVASKGIFIWPMNLTTGYLEDLSVFNNTILITDDVQGAPDPRAGVTFKLKTPTWDMETPMKNIRIYGNYIEFKTRTVSTDLYNADAGVKAYINVNLTDMEIRDNTIVNCGGNGIALHMDTGSTNWIQRVAILKNIFRNTLLPIWLNRNVSDVEVRYNTFRQTQVYATDTDNMKRTIMVANNTYTSNINYTIIDNKVRCISGVNPHYPIYDLSLVDDTNSYPYSRGMRLEKNTPDTVMVFEPPTDLVGAVTTINKGQYIRRNSGLVYKQKFNYPTTIGSLKSADGTTAVTITQWLSATKLQVSDATNIKPNTAIQLDFTNYFTGTVFFVTAVTNNIIETTVGTPATLKGGVIASQVVGSTLIYYTDLSSVLMESNKGTINMSGNGTFTNSSFAHGLSSIPSYYSVFPASADAGTAGIKYVTSDATNLTVYFNNAPISGTNNVTLKWKADV